MLACSREQELSLQEEFVERYVIDGFTASSKEDFITEITVGIAEEEKWDIDRQVSSYCYAIGCLKLITIVDFLFRNSIIEGVPKV